MDDADHNKRPYHHGDLKTALVEAAETLIAREGALDFTLADASRMAGVSSAAPYRHFADKEALLDAVRGRGFERLTSSMRAAIADVGEPGTIDEIIAIGRAYVRFAIAQPAIFRLMFGSRHAPPPAALTQQVGNDCFGTLLGCVDAFRRRHGIGRPGTRTIAMATWSIVHGLGTLAIDHNFDAKAPGTEPIELVEFAGRNFLERLVQKAGDAALRGPAA